MLIAAALSGLEAALPFLTDAVPTGLMAILSMIAVGGGFVARLVVQKDGP